MVAQLNDGVRLLQAQVHVVDGRQLRLCHTSCRLLDAGSLVDCLANVIAWLAAPANPHEVVALVLGNADHAPASRFRSAVQQTGLAEYAFVLPRVPMALQDWPALGELVPEGGKRALLLLDYGANQSQVPYIMDQFSHMWETPFDPPTTGSRASCRGHRASAVLPPETCCTSPALTSTATSLCLATICNPKHRRPRPDTCRLRLRQPRPCCEQLQRSVHPAGHSRLGSPLSLDET